MGASPRRSGRRSAPAATRSARRSPPRTASVLAPESCAAGSLTSGTRPNESCGRPASRRSSGSTSAPRAIPTFSSRIGETGIEVVGENRAQDLEAKHAVYGDAFRWHFIGHLQSRKAKTVNAICELLHSLSSESAAKRLEIPALVEVNLSGEETKSGVSEGDLDALIAAYPDVRGLMTMRPKTEAQESSRPYFRRLRELAVDRGLKELSMGTSQDYRIAVEEGATLIRIGSVLYRG